MLAAPNAMLYATPHASPFSRLEIAIIASLLLMSARISLFFHEFSWNSLSLLISYGNGVIFSLCLVYINIRAPVCVMPRALQSGLVCRTFDI